MSNKVNDKFKLVLLITGCISPSTNQDWLKISDSKERLNQYLDSLSYYINQSLFESIVFCENSNFSDNAIIESMVRLAVDKGKQLEWLSFQGDNSLVESLGKGAGEDEINNYAFANSKLLSDSDSFVKITGRLKVVNINSIIKDIKSKYNYFNMDFYSPRPNCVDTRFYCTNTEYFRNSLTKLYQNPLIANLGKVSFERAMYVILSDRFICFSGYPKFVGVSAGNGRDYSKIPTYLFSLFNTLCKFGIYNCLFPILHFVFFRCRNKLLSIFKKNYSLYGN